MNEGGIVVCSAQLAPPSNPKTVPLQRICRVSLLKS